MKYQEGTGAAPIVLRSIQANRVGVFFWKNDVGAMPLIEIHMSVFWIMEQYDTVEHGLPTTVCAQFCQQGRPIRRFT